MKCESEESNSESNQFYMLFTGLILAVGLMAACDRDFKRPQLSDPTGRAEVTRKDGLLQVEKTAENTAENTESRTSAAEQATIQQKTILPKDTNGEVGSTVASTIRPSNMNSAASSQIDVSKYSYNDKAAFKQLMQARMQAVETGLKELKVEPRKNQVSPRISPESLSALEGRASEVAAELKKVDTVQKNGWDQFKTSFRDDLVGLERSYSMISTARR
jgi:hypothetical protein